jgi:Flagellar C1a complex subunit C1a-32
LTRASLVLDTLGEDLRFAKDHKFNAEQTYAMYTLMHELYHAMGKDLHGDAMDATFQLFKHSMIKRIIVSSRQAPAAEATGVSGAGGGDPDAPTTDSDGKAAGTAAEPTDTAATNDHDATDADPLQVLTVQQGKDITKFVTNNVFAHYRLYAACFCEDFPPSTNKTSTAEVADGVETTTEVAAEETTEPQVQLNDAETA